MKKSMWKKLMSTILALVMVLGLSGTLGFQHVDATENSGFTFLPDKTEVKRGDIVTYSIDLAKNAKIAGITAQFTFDPDVLEAVGDGVDAKGYVKNAVKKGNVSEGTFGDFYVNTDGRIGIVAILNDNDKDKLADGNVAKISFKVKDTAKGDIGLKVKNLEFCDVNSEDIPTSEISVTKDNDAQIKVVVLATGITVDKTATTIVKGATDKLTATLVPADANGTITWSTSDSSVATVSSDGTVTAVKNGTATVTAKCGDLSAQTKVTVINPLKAITITGTTHSIKKGQTTQLGLTYDPADTTDSVAATWTSSNTSVATVSKTGLVTALKDGSTTIKATVGNVSSTYDIAVKEVKLTGIKMEEKALIHKGDTKALTVEYTPADTTDDKTVAWSSSDSTVASVDNNGIVTAVKPGSAVITAKVGNYQATCAVTVDAPLKEIVPEKAIIDMVKKQTANIAYSVVPADTTDSKDVTYTSSDETVATVNSDGKVTAKKAGQATVTITGANGIKATVTVNVSEIPVNEVVLSAQDEIIEAGAKKAITATLKPENNTDDNQGVTWTTSDEKIAKVIVDNEDSHKATIEGVAAGSAVITATAANGTKAECTVKVPKHITSVTLPETVELTRGTSTTLNVTIAPADTDDDTTVTWKSSDSDVVKVDEKTGMVYAVKAGKADVTATTKAVDNATAKPFTATTTVTVKENNMTDEIGKKLAFDEFDDLLIGQKDNANNYLNLSELIEANNITDDINVEFASSDKAVATIDNDGNVFGLKAGKTIITATVIAIAGDGSKNVYTAEGELTVKTIPLNSIAFDKVSISGTKVSNAEKLDFMCRNIDKNSYNKGEAISLPGIYGWVSNDDEFNIAATGGDVGSIKIEKDDDNNSFSVVATDTGRVELTVNLNDASKKINIFIDGIPAEQPVGEMDGTTISESEVYEWDSYTEEYNQISSAILTSTGDLWQTYPQKKKMQSNVKKYVSKWIYSQGPAEIVDYRLDNDNVLWSGDTKIQKNIKDFDGHYAITKDNTLIDLFHDKGENISDVKDWSERKKWTLVLKNDGTLLVREEAKKDAKPNSFETIATGVKEIVGEGYLTSSGDYIRIYFNDNGDREYYTIAQNVESVDSKANCFYGKDGNCYLDAYHTGDHINAGKNKVKQWLYLGNDGATYYYYVTDDGRLECITRTYNFDNNKSTYASYSIMDNIVGIQYDSYKVKAESADNIYYEISKVNATKLDNNNIDSFTLDNNEYSLFVKQGQSFGNIQKNGVNILNNVKYIWANCLDVFALRTDGTIWKVTDKPELYIDLNGTDVKPGDIDGDSNVTTKDLMIVLYGVSGRNTLTEEQKVAADIDGDGKVSISDLTRILYYVSGRNTEL